MINCFCNYVLKKNYHILSIDFVLIAELIIVFSNIVCHIILNLNAIIINIV